MSHIAVKFTTDDEKVAWVREHLAYEMKMLTFTADQIRRLPASLLWNAFYESFTVHARNIHDFLSNRDGGPGRRRPTSGEFGNFRLKEIADFDHLHEQVLHLGRHRPFDPASKFDRTKALKLATLLQDAFGEFIKEFEIAFPSTWDPELINPYKQSSDRTHFGKAEHDPDVTTTKPVQVTTTSIHKFFWIPRDDAND